MLTRLRHRAICSGDDEDSAIHLSSAGDHVLDIVSMARAVNVRVVALLRLILDVCRVDRDTALALLWSLVNISVIHESSLAAFCLGENLRNRSRQRRLAVVDVTNRTDVDVRLFHSLFENDAQTGNEFFLRGKCYRLAVFYNRFSGFRNLFINECISMIRRVHIFQ